MSELDPLEEMSQPLSADNAVDIPSFESEEQKPLFLPGTYLFALGRITPKVENNVTISVAQQYWVLKYIGDPFQPVNEWRIRFHEDGKLYMPTHKGVLRTEFFDNPFLKPTMKWKTSAFYKMFPGVLVEKAGQVPGSPNPVKECNWKVVASKFGQVFEADLVTNNYKAKDGSQKKSMKIEYDTIKLIDRVIPVDQMIAIQSRYDEAKNSEGATSGDYTPPPSDKIDDDLPF